MLQFILRFLAIIMILVLCVAGIIYFVCNSSWCILMPIVCLLETIALAILTVIDFKLWRKEHKEEKKK